MYLYEGHLGGFYTSEEDYDYEYLYCEQCGDSDHLVGWFNGKEDLEELLSFYRDYYDDDYIKETIEELLYEE